MAYTKTEQDKSIAKLRTLAASGARVSVYYQAADSAEMLGVSACHSWQAAAFYLNDDGTDRLRADGSRVSPASIICATEARATELAVGQNIDGIDKVTHPSWFMSGRHIRKARYPREKSDALSA